MAFLDNSGDIILDAVLTDAGRQRLARADGTFRITQFALGDDEINYGLYDTNAETALADVEILKTPVLEAFTNNIASLNSKLMTVPRTNIMYLPVIKLNERTDKYKRIGDNSGDLALNNLVSGSFVICSDTSTYQLINTAAGLTTLNSYLVMGHGQANATATTKIKSDQGLNTVEIGATTDIDPDLKETQYIVEMDNRLGSLVNPINPTTESAKSFVDDDNIASYYFGLATDANYVTTLAVKPTSGNDTENTPLIGARGTSLQFTIKSSPDLRTSGYYFDLLAPTGVSLTATGVSGKIAQVIRSNIVVTGVTTGYSITIPVSYLKIS